LLCWEDCALTRFSAFRFYNTVTYIPVTYDTVLPM
jgi:hypothetical protein